MRLFAIAFPLLVLEIFDGKLPYLRGQMLLRTIGTGHGHVLLLWNMYSSTNDFLNISYFSFW